MAAATPAQELLKLDGDIAPVHDPVAIKERDTYYVFSTGGRNGAGVIPIRTSRDLRTWTLSGFVFDSLPA
jgi:arabinan endo-1,5-alpha-L-arabinosidase